MRGHQAVVRQLLQNLREEFEGNAEALRDRTGTCNARRIFTGEMLQRQQRVIGFLRQPEHGR